MLSTIQFYSFDDKSIILIFVTHFLSFYRHKEAKHAIDVIIPFFVGFRRKQYSRNLSQTIISGFLVF